MPVDPLLKPVLMTFVSETETIIERVSSDILALERGDVSAEEMKERSTNLARGLHTLKGTAATFGLGDLADLAHRLENLVEGQQGADGRMPSHAADALFRTLDVFLERLRGYTADMPDDQLPSLDPALEAIEMASRGAALSGERGEARRKKEAEPEATVDDAATAEATGEYKPAAPSTQELTRPEPIEAAAGDEIGSWRVAQGDVLYLMFEAERLRELRLRLEERASQVDRGIAMLSAATDVEQLEETRAELTGIRAGLHADTEEAADIVNSLEDGIKSICTLPVATVLEPLHRTVRDLCRRSGKQAKLSVVGGELSLDRRLLSSLRGPLVHLIRNAVDHGIEPPDVRDRAGKHSEGALTLRLEQQGNILFVEVADDGSGMDINDIREAALRRGVTTPEEVAPMDRREIQNLIFRTGFTTRTSVTETSGRGVGLDVVRNQLRALQGHIEVLSEKGQGTRFVLTVPAELGSSPILILRAGDHQLGLPMIVVESIVANAIDRLQVSRSHVMVEHRDQLVHLKDLGAMLGQRQSSVPGERQPLVMLQTQGRRVAVAVDEVIGDRDLVIRPLPEELRPIRAYQGAATMARGESLLILRPSWLVEQDLRDESGSARRALVVDDSITARAMHRTVLESGGFVVHTANSAEQALEKVRFAPYEVVVCDLHMEGMSGIELIEELRSRPNTRKLPVVLVSVSDDEGTRRRATTVGADAFITKRDCVSGRLLSEVEQVIARRKSA